MIRGVAYSPIRPSVVFQAIVSLVLILAILAKPSVDAVFHVSDIKTEYSVSMEKQGLEEKGPQADLEDEFQNLFRCEALPSIDFMQSCSSYFPGSGSLVSHFPDIALPPPEKA